VFSNPVESTCPSQKVIHSLEVNVSNTKLLITIAWLIDQFRRADLTKVHTSRYRHLTRQTPKLDVSNFQGMNDPKRVLHFHQMTLVILNCHSCDFVELWTNSADFWFFHQYDIYIKKLKNKSRPFSGCNVMFWLSTLEKLTRKIMTVQGALLIKLCE